MGFFLKIFCLHMFVIIHGFLWRLNGSCPIKDMAILNFNGLFDRSLLTVSRSDLTCSVQSPRKRLFKSGYFAVKPLSDPIIYPIPICNFEIPRCVSTAPKAFNI